MERKRFSMWGGMGLPAAWMKEMGYKDDEIGGTVYPIVDNKTCGPIEGWPRPDQMLCWCSSIESQRMVWEGLNRFYEWGD